MTKVKLNGKGGTEFAEKEELGVDLRKLRRSWGKECDQNTLYNILKELIKIFKVPVSKRSCWEP